MSKLSEIEALRAKIAAVFPTDPVPEAEELFPAAAGGDPEAVDYEEFYGGHRWTELTEEDLFHNRAAISFFSPVGWAYYLPAFLYWGVAGEDADVLSYTFYALYPIRPYERERVRQRIEQLTPVQQAVVREVLQCLCAHFLEEWENDTRERIRETWGPIC